MLRSTTARTTAAALAALVLLVAACGDDDEEPEASTESPTTTESPATTEAATGDDPAAAPAVEVVDSDLGQILASDGRTLYVFLPDAGSAPTCYDECAATWPPLPAEGETTVGEGLDAALFASVARDDGGEQVTVDGWPLYFFANDQAPGDTNGQGLNDVWYVVGPDGVAIQT